MRKIIYLSLFIASFMFATEIKWEKDYKSALEISEKSKKPVLMLIDGVNCPFCELLKADVLSDKKVANFINENFVPIHVLKGDGTYPAKKFTVYGTPTTYFITSKGEQQQSPIIGYVKKSKYLKYLNMGLKSDE